MEGRRDGEMDRWTDGPREEGDKEGGVMLKSPAVSNTCTHTQGWQYLGTTQADNEQEMAAIAALKK